MEILVVNGDLIKQKTNILVVNLFEGVKNPGGATGTVDKALDNMISDFVIRKEKFEGKFGTFYLLPTNNKIPADKVLIVGLGEKEKFNLNRLMVLSSKIIQYIKGLPNNSKVSSILHGAGIGGYSPFSCARAISEGSLIGAYDFNKYKSDKKEKGIKEFNIVEFDKNAFEEAQEGVKLGIELSCAVNFARNLVNEPPQFATPQKLADVAKSIKGIETKILNKDEIEKEGMGAFLAVGRGSVHEPRFIHMKYSVKNPKKKIALIGKGITFDSGGLDIKPPSSMLNMKDDMSASAAVLAVMNSLAILKPEVEVHGIIAACENMPGGKAYKPGDILTAKNGKTIEVDNTDAEGRLTLADALCYAEELGVDEIIDAATLTGACMVALGSVAAGIMGNNQKLIDRLMQTAEKSGEYFWQLPMYDEYNDSLKSDIADMKNTGSRWGGASTAGCFLKNFVKKTPWAHIDIAGTAYIEKAQREFPKGATGATVRTFINYLLDY